MCDPDRLTTGQSAIITRSRAVRDTAVNLPPLSGIVPDQQPSRDCEGALRMPTSTDVLFHNLIERIDELRANTSKVDDLKFLTMGPDSRAKNVRNAASAHWRRGSA